MPRDLDLHSLLEVHRVHTDADGDVEVHASANFMENFLQVRVGACICCFTSYTDIQAVLVSVLCRDLSDSTLQDTSIGEVIGSEGDDILIPKLRTTERGYGDGSLCMKSRRRKEVGRLLYVFSSRRKATRRHRFDASVTMTVNTTRQN